MVRRRRADAPGAATAPGEVVPSRGELAVPLWGRAWPGQRCNGAQRQLSVEGPGASDSPSFLPARLFRLTLQSWAQDMALCLREAIVGEGATREEGRGGDCRKTGEEKSCLRSR